MEAPSAAHPIDRATTAMRGDNVTRASGFMPQLDGLRAFAVAAVLVHHLLDVSILPEAPFSLSWGLLGVRLFFVLSGFLITGLLIQGRDAVDAGPVSRSDVLKRFYLRRTLRIFPLYYLVLGIALAFGGEDVRAQLPWLATYTYNFWISALGWFPAHFSHFWSLCVEEQFYLLWPWVILFAPRNRLFAIALLMTAVAPLYRIVAWQLEFREVAFYTLTPSSFDSLGMGALLAIACRAAAADAGAERLLRYTALPIGLVSIAMMAGSGPWFAVLGETAVALVFVWLVAGASRGFGGLGRRVLEAKPILYLGKISYGVYVYHLLVPGVFGPVLDALGVRLPPKGIVEFLVFSALAIGVASLSWFCIERPINRLKRHFSLSIAHAESAEALR